MKNFLITALLASFIGCAHAPVPIIDPLAQPQYGMTKQQLTDSMGMPDSIEMYNKPDETRMEFYIYVRAYPSSDTHYKLPVCLIDNKVVGWGKTYYEDHILPNDVRIK